MDFYKEKFLLKDNVQNKIVTSIFYKEKKGSMNNKINKVINLEKQRKLIECKKNNNYNFKISRTTTVSIKSKIINNNGTGETCAICLNEVSFENKHFLHCGHIFHCSCINYWINNGSNLCPICRGNIRCVNEDYSIIDFYENENNNNYYDDNFLNNSVDSINNNRIERNNNRVERNNNRIGSNRTIRDKIGKSLKYLKYLVYAIIFFYSIYFFLRHKKVLITVLALYFLLVFISGIF